MEKANKNASDEVQAELKEDPKKRYKKDKDPNAAFWDEKF